MNFLLLVKWNFDGSWAFILQWLLSRVSFCDATWLCSQTGSTLRDVVGLLSCLCLLRMKFMQMIFTAPSLLSFEAVLSSGNTISVRGICSNILQRSMELLLVPLMDNYACDLCTFHVLWDQDKIQSWPRDVSADMHSVCSLHFMNSFFLAVTLLLSSSTILQYWRLFTILLLV